MRILFAWIATPNFPFLMPPPWGVAMFSSPAGKLLLLIVLLPLSVLNAACGPAPDTELTRFSNGTYPVDPLFREMYGLLGGRALLGPAITEMRNIKDTYRVQITVSAMMVYNMNGETGPERFSLAPLGNQLQIAEPAVSPPPNLAEESRYINGHIIHKKFYPTYLSLQGARFVGLPITEVRYNPEKQRLEQYFENLGFFIEDDDPDGTVQLLAYGSYLCDTHCRFPTNPKAIVSQLGADQTALPEPFAVAISQLKPGFVGIWRAGPYQTEDGSTEVIFDNLVLYTEPRDPNRVYARPIVEKLGIAADPPVAPIPDKRMIFYQTAGELGHNVPTIFGDYLAEHGGLDLAGPPITEIFLIKDNLWRQCFTNLCLDYHHGDQILPIRPAGLGFQYKALFYNPVAEGVFSDSESLANLRMLVWENKPMITSSDIQMIFVAILEGGKGVPNLEPELTVTYPEGEIGPLPFPPTNPDGMTQLDLPPVKASNGTLIPYEVCLQNIQADESCVGDTFLIWGNP